MQLSCPNCGTREIKVSARHGIGEAIKGICGIDQIRCRRCKTRWQTSMWENQAWKYARCPRCYRQDLSTWSEQYYHPPFDIYLKIRLGATPYRCNACRCNFASFRPCRQKFVWRHRSAEPQVHYPQPSASNESDLRALAEAVGSKTVQPQATAAVSHFSEPRL